MGKQSRLVPCVAAAILCLLLYDVHLRSLQPNAEPRPHFSPVAGQRIFGSRGGTGKPAQGVLAEADSAHVIQNLMVDGDARHNALLATETTTVEDAAAAYRRRRGRHPPPGFHLWHEYAKSHNALVIEEFWDQIYEDLNPFWALAPSELRGATREMGMTVAIESGKARATTEWFWHTVWAKMISEVSEHLPDMVIACNPMDEPRVIIPFSNISTMIEIAESQKPDYLVADHIHDNITGWTTQKEELEVDAPRITWRTAPPYTYARRACSPDSPARQQSATSDLTLDQVVSTEGRFVPELSSVYRQGFVANSTEASNLCHDPGIMYYHAALTDPLSASTCTDPLPMFGGSKFANVNNDILMPAPMYWNEETRFLEEDEIPWSEKSSSPIIWRGTATGGWNKPNTWSRFHRHRFVALTNGTKHLSESPEPADMFSPLWNFTAISFLAPSIQRNLPQWLNSTMDIGFTDLFCDTHNDPHDAEANEPGQCWYTSPHYEVLPTIKLSEQYKSKYLPDIDGNSFSGRYRSFLLSNSLPIKATLYREWHDSRLIAWKHFVPMNNRFDDFFRLMQYFVGCSEEVCGKAGVVQGHDAEAEKIAREGKEWAEKVLRKEDMQIYVFRLLLEWARITDDERLSLGWVDDLRGP